MEQLIVTVDVVGSTAAKEDYGETHAIKMISAALRMAEESLRAGEPALHNPGVSMGDSVLLVGGTNIAATYKAAVLHQSSFISWDYNRMAVKIAIGFGDFTTAKDENGVLHLRGLDLDFLHRMNEYCPAAGIVVSPSAYALIKDGGFGDRFDAVREKMKGFGETPRLFYESDGDYEIADGERQRRHQRPHLPVPQVVAPVEPAPTPIFIPAATASVGHGIGAREMILWALLVIGFVLALILMVRTYW